MRTYGTAGGQTFCHPDGTECRRAAHTAAALESHSSGISYVWNSSYPDRPSSAPPPLIAIAIAAETGAWFDFDDWCWRPMDVDVVGELLGVAVAP